MNLWDKGTGMDLVVHEDECTRIYGKKNIFFFFIPIIDVLIVELRSLFSGETMQLAMSCKEFLRMNKEDAEFFIAHFSVPGVDKRLLHAEMEITRRVTNT